MKQSLLSSVCVRRPCVCLTNVPPKKCGVRFLRLVGHTRATRRESLRMIIPPPPRELTGSYVAVIKHTDTDLG